MHIITLFPNYTRNNCFLMKRNSEFIPSLQSTAFKPLHSSLAILLALVTHFHSFQEHYGNAFALETTKLVDPEEVYIQCQN